MKQNLFMQSITYNIYISCIKCMLKNAYIHRDISLLWESGKMKGWLMKQTFVSGTFLAALSEEISHGFGELLDLFFNYWCKSLSGWGRRDHAMPRGCGWASVSQLQPSLRAPLLAVFYPHSSLRLRPNAPAFLACARPVWLLPEKLSLHKDG